MNKYLKPLVIIISFLILCLVTTASYAYFSAVIKGNDNSNYNVITSGYMAIEFEDGPEINLENAIPGSSLTKTFKVKNTGTVTTTYDVYFSFIQNYFNNPEDLVYTVASINGCSNENERMIPTETNSESKLISSCSITPNQTHEYELTIKFLNRDYNQDENKFSYFGATLSINEYFDNKVYAYVYDKLEPAELIKKVFNEETHEYEYQTQTANKHLLVMRNTLNGDEQECEKNNDNTYNCSNASQKGGKKLVAFYDITNLNFSEYWVFAESYGDNYYYDGYEDLITDVDIQEKLYPTYTASWFSNLYNVKHLDLKNLDTSFSKNMNCMFNEMISLEELDVKHFKTNNVGSMISMFSDLRKIKNLDLTNFDTSNVLEMAHMFSNMYELESIDLSSFSIENARETSSMFSNDKNLTSLDLSSFKENNARYMDNMFHGCEQLTNLNISNLDTSCTAYMSSMFEGLKSIRTIDISSFSHEKLLSIENMFKDDINLETIYIGKNWYQYKKAWGGPSNSSAFKNCNKLVGGAGTTYTPNDSDSRYANIDGIYYGQPGYFTFKGTQEEYNEIYSYYHS